MTSPVGHEVHQFPAVLQSKMAKLQDLVEARNAEAGNRQKAHYDKVSTERHFVAGDRIWLSIPTAGKLDPRWDGRWHIRSIVFTQTHADCSSWKGNNHQSQIV